MTAGAVGLILCSALLHAGWNLIGKRTAQTVRFYAWTMATGLLIFSPLLLLSWPVVPSLPALFWWLLLGSGVCQCLYMTGLAKAYRVGNLSMVYPLARALPVLLVPLLVVLIYGESRLSPRDLFGMLLIILGALALPLAHWRDWHPANYRSPAVGWALLAAASTAGYSLLDSMAIQVLLKAGLSPFQAGSSFVLLQAAITVLLMVPCISLLFREPLLAFPDAGWTTLAGFFVVGTYMLVLISMSLVTEVSYVVALRQLSIPIGFVIGILWLKEPVSLPRIQGLLVMLVGLLLVSL